ncbi:hypothetical protein ACF1BX_28245 [Streptomyces globisporus]
MSEELSCAIAAALAVGRLSSTPLAVRLLERWPTLRPLPAHNTRPWC